MCVLDFFVHEKYQRKGFGYKLFQVGREGQILTIVEFGVLEVSKNDEGRPEYNCIWSTVVQDASILNEVLRLSSIGLFSPCSDMFISAMFHRDDEKHPT